MPYRVLMPLLLLLLTGFAEPDPSFARVCPGVPLQIRTSGFSPSGLILTAFDRTGIWLYDINRSARYPLPETRPCNRNCRLSPDARWITYVDPRTGAYGKMRLNGTERTLLSEYATDIEWWPDNRLLVWTPGHQAYTLVEGSPERTYLDVEGIVSVQPGGTWGLHIAQDGDHFTRSLLNLETRHLQGIAGQSIPIGENVPYFDAAGWSPDGTRFAYVSPVVFDQLAGIAGAELFIVQPGTAEPVQYTDLNSVYGAVRINGGVRGELYWSPDSSRIAFWVIELLGPDYQHNTGSAMIHILDTNTGLLSAYCGFTTTEHTPDPPRLQWSPDGTHIAFGGNIPADDKGYLLLALDTESGIFTELSDGIFPAMGMADVIAWGLPPG
jgi:WD40 repeat protein